MALTLHVIVYCPFMPERIHYTLVNSAQLTRMDTAMKSDTKCLKQHKTVYTMFREKVEYKIVRMYNYNYVFFSN